MMTYEAGHHWFINRDDDFRELPVRCECGEMFAGLVAWSEHLRESRKVAR